MKTENTRDADFSFGVREVQRQQQREALRTARTPPERPVNRGADPYNTSGSFDRRNNWKQVYKR